MSSAKEISQKISENILSAKANGKEIPTRCIDPCIKYCQGCKHGWVEYPAWIETREDLEGCCFESGCRYGLEDTIPTKEENEAFERMIVNAFGKDGI